MKQLKEKEYEEFQQYLYNKLLEQYEEGKEIHIFKSREEDANRYLETDI